MNINWLFWIDSAMLGTGLAMDAFSVSLADGLHEPSMEKYRRNLIAGTFSVFQFAMPLIGWACVHTAVNTISVLAPLIPWIAAVLLFWIGAKMVHEGIQEIRQRKASDAKACGPEEAHGSEKGRGAEEAQVIRLTTGTLIVQAFATSIDALSAGFTIATHGPKEALMSCLTIGAVTFLICAVGVRIGRRAGAALSGNASVFGGLILILLGIQSLF